MDHHLVMILAEVLDQITLIEVAIKGQNRKLFKKFIFQYILGKGGVECIGGDGSGSVEI